MTGLPSEVDIAVIGAGAAGIGAARRLVKAGAVSVLVLEARDRVGGRVWSRELPNGAVVEIMGVADGSGVRGRDKTTVPGIMGEFLRRINVVQEWTVEAALTGNRTLVLEASGPGGPFGFWDFSQAAKAGGVTTRTGARMKEWPGPQSSVHSAG